MPGPWFHRWPQDLAATKPAPGQSVRRVSLAAAARRVRAPHKFAHLLPFEAIIPARGRVYLPLVLDDDLPFRLDAIQTTTEGAGATWLRLGVELGAGRRLTRGSAHSSAFSGEQGGKAWVAFRYRFQPGELLALTIENTHPTEPATVRGVLVGVKLTAESRL
jgi:hypothetical protein